MGQAGPKLNAGSTGCRSRLRVGHCHSAAPVLDTESALLPGCHTRTWLLNRAGTCFASAPPARMRRDSIGQSSSQTSSSSGVFPTVVILDTDFLYSGRQLKSITSKAVSCVRVHPMHGSSPHGSRVTDPTSPSIDRERHRGKKERHSTTHCDGE